MANHEAQRWGGGAPAPPRSTPGRAASISTTTSPATTKPDAALSEGKRVYSRSAPLGDVTGHGLGSHEPGPIGVPCHLLAGALRRVEPSHAQRAQYNSTQQILDRRLQLRGIIRPVPINLEAVSADRPAIGGAPLVQGLVSGGHVLVAPAVDDHGGLARRRSDTLDLALAGEGANHLDAEVDRHDLRVLMMIEEHIVAVGAEARVLLEERPHSIQRRPEFLGDVVHRDAAADGRERAGAKRLDGYFVGHDSLLGARSSASVVWRSNTSSAGVTSTSTSAAAASSGSASRRAAMVRRRPTRAVRPVATVA